MSVARLTDPQFGASINAHLNSLHVGRLTIAGREITTSLDDNHNILELITQIQTKIAELEVFCRALSDAIYIGPAPDTIGEVRFPASR